MEFLVGIGLNLTFMRIAARGVTPARDCTARLHAPDGLR